MSDGRHDDFIEVVPVDDAGDGSDEVLPQPPEPRRLRAPLIAGIVVALLVAVVLVRALSSGSAGSTGHPRASVTVALPTVLPDGSLAPGPDQSGCTSYACLDEKRVSMSQRLLRALAAQYPHARLLSATSYYYVSTGALRQRRLVARSGLRRIVIDIRPPRARDKLTAGYRDDGSGSTAYYATKLEDKWISIRVSVPTGAIQLSLKPLARLSTDARLLAVT